jgi:hypothetical protein
MVRKAFRYLLSKRDYRIIVIERSLCHSNCTNPSGRRSEIGAQQIGIFRPLAVPERYNAFAAKESRLP